ncbi:hypothetical protein GCM10011504_53400 [Siccirubricoccus deserti]|nr:hypothetical protein GCM10011504_53400 [Siccirubricoccus deserti]
MTVYDPLLQDRPSPAAYSAAAAKRVVRTALLTSLGRRVLPKGAADLPRRLAEIVLVTRVPIAAARPLAERLRGHHCRLYLAEARRRSLPTSLNLIKRGLEPLRMTSEAGTPGGRHVALLTASGWAEYPGREFRRAALSVLAGRDDAGLWGVRVPSTLRDADAALIWLEPAVVRRTREAGLRVLRQGDLWVMERRRGGCGMAASAIPAGHVWDAAARVLRHGAHDELSVPFPATAVVPATLAPRGTGRRRGGCGAKP